MSTTDADAAAASRRLATYALSLQAMAVAQIAWGERRPWLLAAQAAAVLLALLAGEALRPALGPWSRGGGARARLVAHVAHGGVLLLAAVAIVAAPGPAMLLGCARVLSAAQLAILALAGLREDDAAPVGNALALGAIAALRGGAPAVVSAYAVLALPAWMMACHHLEQTLHAFPVRAQGLLRGVAVRVAFLLLPSLGALTLALVVRPPQPWAAAAAPPSRGTARMTASNEAWRSLSLIGLVGGLGLYGAGKLLRGLGGTEPPLREIVDPLREAPEPLPDPQVRRSAPQGGDGARVVRAYLAFLAAAARGGYERAPSVTAREFAGRVRAPLEPLRRLTELFMRARYGLDPVAPADADAAEQAQDALSRAIPRRARRA